MKKYKLIDHTADAGIEAYGKNLNGLFENAASGMFAVLCDSAEVKPAKSTAVRVKAKTLEDLMHHWLTELLYRVNKEEILFGKFRVKISGKYSLTGKASGEKISPVKHHLKTEIKEVTYYQLEIKRYAIRSLPANFAGRDTRFAYKVRVIFDV